MANRESLGCLGMRWRMKPIYDQDQIIGEVRKLFRWLAAGPDEEKVRETLVARSANSFDARRHAAERSKLTRSGGLRLPIENTGRHVDSATLRKSTLIESTQTESTAICIAG
jgi:hypothetical protein